MDQNTAQDNSTNNVQFNYPDFSTVGDSSSVNSSNQVVQNNESSSKKIDELKHTLEDLIHSEEKSAVNENVQQTASFVETPVSSLPTSTEEPVVPPQPPPVLPNQEITSPATFLEEPIQPPTPVNEQQSQEEIYVQQPTPLPALDQEEGNIQSDIAEENTSIDPFIPKDLEFTPLPTDIPKFKETLEQVIPDSKKPKAMERAPKKDNLSEPVDVNTGQREKDDLVKEEVREKKLDSDESDDEVLTASGDITMEKLLREAVTREASDLHITVGYPPVIRIDGDLMALDEYVLSPKDVESLIFSVLTDERKELLEVNREIDFAYTYEGVKNARFRVNAFYAMRNLSAAFRLIPSRIRTVEELLLPQIYHQFAKLKQGLILVTGPTGHGKSTTLAAILEAVNRTRFCHIVTIEDPIEYVFEGKKALIDQREMNDDTHSWNIALRSVMRQDPDVILVGEMRDFETIASAITLAETGHLVFATLHTNSASQTLDRIIDVFPENQQQQVRTQIATTLAAVIAQRLIPLDKGGRRAVSEIMLNNSAVKNLIREGKMHQIDNVIRTSADIGMVHLERSLVGLVREGVISVQRAQEYAVHPEEVLRLLKA